LAAWRDEAKAARRMQYFLAIIRNFFLFGLTRRRFCLNHNALPRIKF